MQELSTALGGLGVKYFLQSHSGSTENALPVQKQLPISYQVSHHDRSEIINLREKSPSSLVKSVLVLAGKPPRLS